MADEPQTIEMMWHLLRDANDVAVADLEAKANQPGSLDHAFDALRILTFVEHIAATLGCIDEASLDFEGKRGDVLKQMEQGYHNMMAAKAAAEQQAQWSMPPNRQQRRHPSGPQGIVRP